VSAGGTLVMPMYTRPRDASAILDRIGTIATQIGVAIDPANVAVLGHSGGAHAVMALAGAVIDVSPSVHAMPSRDARFKAYVANSPQGLGRMGLTATSWAAITVPMMIQTGRNDGTSTSPPPADRRVRPPDRPRRVPALPRPRELDPRGVRARARPGITGNELTLASTAVAFLDAYVLKRPEAVAWLATDALNQATGGRSTLSRK